MGQGRPFVAALLNIDLAAVGSWAERRGLAYTSYTDLSQKPEVYELIRQEVARVNRSLLEEPSLRGAQIRAFLMLHKELDPDDQEITRTRKVRRGFIAQKYAALIEALYCDERPRRRSRRRSPTRTGAPARCAPTCASGRRRSSRAGAGVRPARDLRAPALRAPLLARRRMDDQRPLRRRPGAERG